MKDKITVVTWDAGYREDVRDALACLGKQTVLDRLNCIHIEWGAEPNPTFLEYDFIKVYCLNLPKRIERPSFDTGIQWSFGLYISETPWVSYCHCDIMARDFYEKLLNKIDILDSQKSDVLYLEGWQVNAKKFPLKWRYREYEGLKRELGSDLDLLPYKYDGAAKQDPVLNGVGVTVKKEAFIDECDGWMWNVANRSEYYTGPGFRQPKYDDKGLREFLLLQKKALCMQKEMVKFAIPHPTTTNRKKHKNALYPGGIKHCNDFITEWIPENFKKEII